jgi:outer membrane protein assembly factor BamA
LLPLYRISTTLLLLLFSLQATAQDVIQDIRFEGNAITEAAIMLQEMVIKTGDEVDIGKIETSVQHIMDLGLFEQVNYRLDEDASDSGKILTISVIERYYLIPLPTAKLNDNSELEYGVKLRWNNIWGLNHSLNWKILDKGSSRGVHEFSIKADYAMPRLFFSRYQLTLITETTVDVDEDPTFGAQRQRASSYGVDILKWLNKDGVSAGLFAGGGISYRSKQILALDVGGPPNQTENAVVYSARIGYDKTHEYLYNRGGISMQYRIDFSSGEGAYGDTTYSRHEFDFRNLHAYSREPPVNFNYHIVIGQSNNDVLGDKAFSLGGNTNLRGYRTDTYRGNALLRMNLEYLSKIGESSLLRKVYFLDTGDTPDRLSDIRLSSFKSSVGAGIRWKLRQFVNLDLRLDAAYAFETDDFHISLGTHGTF